MKKKSLGELNKVIEEKRKEVNEQIALSRESKRKKRYRVRSKGEREALDKLSIARWRKALERGEVIKLGPRKFYYDHRTVGNDDEKE